MLGTRPQGRRMAKAGEKRRPALRGDGGVGMRQPPTLSLKASREETARGHMDGFPASGLQLKKGTGRLEVEDQG